MTHLKLQKLQKDDHPPAHCLSVNVLLSNIIFFVIFAVLDVSFAVNSCINHSFLHLYLQFHYVSVAVTLFRVRSTWYGVRGPHHFLGAPVAHQPLPSLVLKGLKFLSFRLKSPIHAPKIWVFGGVLPPNLGAHHSDPQKAHPCVISRLLSYRV